MALPNTNISTTLVGTTLGVSTRDVGQLCLSSAVNKWSKWKPVRWNKVDGITLANLEAINYGITYNSYANIDAIKAAYEANEEVITYAKPRGGLYNEPYRLGDFRNYEHSSIQPIVSGMVTQQAQNIVGGQNSITGTILINGRPKPEEIGWEDLGLNGRKLAIALYSGTTLVKTAVAANSGDTSVTLDTRSPLPVLDAGIYNAYMFLTNNVGVIANNLAGIPAHLRFGYPVEVLANVVFVSIQAKWDILNPRLITIRVFCLNSTGSNISLLNCNLRVRNSANECSSIIQEQEQVLPVPSTITVPSSSTPQEIYSVTREINRDFYPAWKVCWSNTGAHPYTFESAIIEEME